MKICLVGDFSKNPDEGMKGVAHNLARELAKTHLTFKFNILKPLQPAIWCELKHFSPDIVHYLSGPSPLSFILLQTLLLVCKSHSNHEVCSVMSATQPWLPFNSISFLAKLKPDLMLVQSVQSQIYFRKMGFFTKYLPNGVNVDKFRPVDENLKNALREKYGLNNDDFVVLHVGPIRANRGLHVLKSVAKGKNRRVLIVGSTSSPLEKNVFIDLTKGGCIIWRKYIEPIQEVYQLSDLYVFPVQDQLGSIEAPLSVLEAMSCNLPVITTRYGGLERMFSEGDGLYFVYDNSQIPALVDEIQVRTLNGSSSTRLKVTPYSWHNISKILSNYYNQLVQNRKRIENSRVAR